MDKLPIEPMGNYLVVQIVKETEKITTGGIVLPQKALERPEKGTVLATGGGQWDSYAKTFIPMRVKVGDTIYFARYAPVTIEYQGEEISIISESEVYFIDRSTSEEV